MSYNWKQVKAYAKIGLHNLLHSGNRDDIDNLETFDMFLEPLKEIHKKEDVVKYAENLIEKQDEKQKKLNNNKND